MDIDAGPDLPPPGPSVGLHEDPLGPIPLHLYRSAGFRRGGRVVIVHHGVLRNAADYCRFWYDAAESHDLLVVAPEFAAGAFPGPERYNDGGVLAAGGSATGRDAWAYGAAARLIARLGPLAGEIRVFGHSAGSQFAHRMLATLQPKGLTGLIAANAGWYTLPTLARPFPEGLGGIGLGKADLAAFLAFPLVILAGDADTQTTGEHLPSHPEASRQGAHRFARAQAFHAAGQAEAARHGLPCAWRLVIVPGVGHEGETMSKAAAAFWFGGSRR